MTLSFKEAAEKFAEQEPRCVVKVSMGELAMQRVDSHSFLRIAEEVRKEREQADSDDAPLSIELMARVTSMSLVGPGGAREWDSEQGRQFLRKLSIGDLTKLCNGALRLNGLADDEPEDDDAKKN